MVPGELQKRIRNILNEASAEKASDTPDYVLAAFLIQCLGAFDRAVNQREAALGPAIRVAVVADENGASANGL